MCKYKIRAYAPEELGELKNIWNVLYEGVDMTYFQSYDWYEIMNSMLPSKGEVVYLMVSDDMQPVLVAPLWILQRTFKLINRRGCYFFGRGGYTDYLNFIYKTFDPGALEALFIHVKVNYGTDRYFLECMPEHSASYRYIVQTKAVMKSHRSVCVRLVLPDNVDQYDGMLSKHVRQNLRTAKNRCQKDGIVLTQTFHTETTDRQLIDSCKRIRETRLGIKTRNDRKRMSFVQNVRNNVERILKYRFPGYNVLDVHAKGWLLTVSKDDKTCAFFHGGYDTIRRCLVVMCAGLDPEYARYSPGLLSMYNHIKSSLDDKRFNSVDFTRGDEKYKYDLGGESKYIYHVQFKI